MAHTRAILRALTVSAVLAGPCRVVEDVEAQQKPDTLHSGRPAHDATGELVVLPVQGNVYLIAGHGPNITVQASDQGAIVVDTGVASISDKVVAEIKKLTKGPIKGIIDTNTDLDHISGNEKLAKAGAPLYGAAGGANDGAPIFAHEKALNRISAPTGQTSAIPSALWPTDTFTTAKKSIFFNHEAIEILHQPGPTDGNVIVFFRRSDVIVAGDIFMTTAYPMFDTQKGGSMQGVLDGLNRIVDLAVPELNQQGGTRIVPGHGRIANQSDVVEYRDMATIVRDRVRDLIKAGSTLEQIKAAKPTLDYDGLYSTPQYTGEMFVEALYRDLGRSQKPAPAAKPARKGKS